ncbi:uncharacterized protein [Aristolochia californica]|uniref:uncharacterized protein n=1 Tax=Aristolochia californica TaxID=171875 RepID=UPI0035DC02EC
MKNLMPSRPRPQKTLQFDRRYGWVIDEWKDPVEVALAGGRGMFCILPLAKSLVEIALPPLNFMSSSIIRIIERPEVLSPQALKTTVDDRFQTLMRSIQRPNLNLLLFKDNLPFPAICFSKHLHHDNSNQ